MHSLQKFNPEKDYEIDMGPSGNERQLESYSRPLNAPYSKNILNPSRDRQMVKETKMATNVSILQQRVSPNLAKVSTSKIPVRRHLAMSTSRGQSPLTSPRIHSKIVKKPPQDISMSAMANRKKGSNDLKSESYS